MCKPKIQFITFLILVTLLVSPSLAQDLVWKSGTIIALLFTNDRILVAADSREQSSDSSVSSKEPCKIIRLDDHTFLAVEGLARAEGVNGYDALQLARKAYKEIPSHQAREVATRWADLMVKSFELISHNDIDSYANVITPWQLAGGVLGTVTDGGFELYEIDIGMAADPDDNIPGTFHPRVWRKVWPVLPKVGALMSLGSLDRHLVAQFEGNTERAAKARDLLRQAINAGKEPDEEVGLLRASVQYAIDNAANKKAVGGYINILELRKGGKASWIDAPKCQHDLQE